MMWPFRKVQEPKGAELKQLEERVHQLQHAIVIQSERISYLQTDVVTSNPYPTADAQIAELSLKFEGKAAWGNQIAANLISLRAAFTIGSGVKIHLRKDKLSKKKELEFIEEFIRLNNLDEEVTQEWVQEAEIEGRWCGVLSADSDNEGVPKVRFLSYEQHKYSVQASANDYARYEKVSYKTPGSDVETVINAPHFVYASFGGRTHKVNDCPPRLGSVLREIEAMDKALQDLRMVNHLYATQTPWFNCEDTQTANWIQSRIEAGTWKIGKALITAKCAYSMVGASTEGQAALINEYTANAKVVSGASAVPVHFLGLPELMGQGRATADSLMELVNAGTIRERRIWVGAYEELFGKALQFSNDNYKTNFDTECIEVDIPQISENKMQEIKDVWLPLWEADAISQKTLIGKLPDVDYDDEMAQIQDEKDERIANNPLGALDPKAGIAALNQQGQEGEDPSVSPPPPPPPPPKGGKPNAG